MSDRMIFEQPTATSAAARVLGVNQRSTAVSDNIILAAYHSVTQSSEQLLT